MNFPDPPRYQKIGFWGSMPFIVLALTYIMYGQRLFHTWQIWAIAYPIIYFIGYFSWRFHYVYDHYIQTRFPSVEESPKRVWLIALVNIFVMTPTVVLIFVAFDQLSVMGYELKTNDLWKGYLVGLGVNIVFESLWEVIFIIEKYKETAAEKEILAQMQIRQEFDNLKQKVNPHFLFNSFNTLSSLIPEDKDRAETFLDELSKVYRYLLRNNESGMSTVEQEMRFITSYANLLTTRYGQGLVLTHTVDPSFGEKHLPSLTLQLLLENVVKHNVISKTQPIEVMIRSTPDGHLVMENTLNKKTWSDTESTGIGLANIREKYRLLNAPEVTITESDNRYAVTIPLL